MGPISVSDDEDVLMCVEEFSDEDEATLMAGLVLEDIHRWFDKNRPVQRSRRSRAS
jgi:hypothetical protein